MKTKHTLLVCMYVCVTSNGLIAAPAPSKPSSSASTSPAASAHMTNPPGGPLLTETSEKDTKSASSLPSSSASTEPSASVPAAPAAPSCLPTITKPVTGSEAQAVVLGLPCSWKNITDRIEQRILELVQNARESSYEEDVLRIMQMEEVGSKGERVYRRIDPVVAAMKEYMPAAALGLPSIPTLLQSIFTPAFSVEIDALLKASEEAVTALLEKNPQRFHQFRDLQRKGMQWPHSAQMRRLWESGDFAYRPMMIKRDRMVCETCGAEVSALNPWDRPQYYHNLAKHPQDYLATLAKRNPILAWVVYGENAPAVTAAQGAPEYEQQKRDLLDYMLCHIDAYVAGKKPQPLETWNDPLARRWYNVYGTQGQCNGWTEVARYIQNPQLNVTGGGSAMR